MQELELNKVHNMSWEEGFQRMADGMVDLIITSPPYNLGGKFHTGDTVYKKAYNLKPKNL